MDIQIKRIYEKPSSDDGARVLVDRLWPRGISKERAKLDLWMKDIAPSTKLRRWFSHDPKKWPKFREKYIAELKQHAELLGELKIIYKKHGKLTLLYAAKDTAHNEAKVIKEALE